MSRDIIIDCIGSSKEESSVQVAEVSVGDSLLSKETGGCTEGESEGDQVSDHREWEGC